MSLWQQAGGRASNRSPMRRGLKRIKFGVAHDAFLLASNRSPMRRGLKRSQTRTYSPLGLPASNRSPMRRGLKLNRPNEYRAPDSSFKPIPDEEGTETVENCACTAGLLSLASNRSPMRRGLKRNQTAPGARRVGHASNRSPMRRGLKPRTRRKRPTPGPTLQTDPR